MDYMLLGVQSRKTGLNAKENIKRDEYSMENIDDFFKDDDTSLTSSRDKTRRSSLLSSLSKKNILPTAEYQSPVNRGFKSAGFASSRRSTEQFLGHGSPSVQNGLGIIEENVLPPDAFESENSYEKNVNYSKALPDNRLDVTIDRGSIKLTPEKKSDNVIYNDVPDLIDDDEDDTRDFTPLNTSENALLEDELDDDYVAESEEDRDYVEGESLLNEEETNYGDDDDDDDDNEEEEDKDDSDDDDNSDYGSIDIARRKSTTKTSPNRQMHIYGGAEFPTEVYDSDEEYIQKQAQELIDIEPADRSNGLRRSSRVKVAPLEYWRNERVVYKRKSSKPVLDIDKIVTYDHNDDEEEEDEMRKGRKKKKSSVRTRPYNYIPTGKPRGRPRKNRPDSMNSFNPNIELLDDINFGKVQNAEWLKHGILEANVNISADRTSNEIVAFAPNLAQSEQIKETDDESFSLEVMFDKHKEHFASGMLKLPVRGKKKLSNSFRTFITFYIIQGVVEITLAANVFLSTEGSSFQIPAFNEYGFENRGNNELKMFFVQVTLREPEDRTTNENEKEVTNTEVLDTGISENEGSLSSMSMSEI